MSVTLAENRTDSHPVADPSVKIAVRDLDFYYGDFQALTGITCDIKDNSVTAFIGPSGCGKSTFLRASIA